jgi:hypothetical protein
VVVRGLAIAPVKGTRLRAVDRVELGPSGVRENRRFYLIDERDRMINGKHVGELQTLVSEYDDADRCLRIAFPDGRVLEEELVLGEAVRTGFYSRPVSGRLVQGAWSTTISEYVGQPLRLVEAGPAGAVDRGARGAVSLVSTASLDRLAQAAEHQAVDVRRFRMLVEIEGVAAHTEDRWVRKAVRVGEARIRFEGHVGRCLVTSRDPDDGHVDLPTLEILGTYREDRDTTEPLPFGIYGRVLHPGTMRVGDVVEPEG